MTVLSSEYTYDYWVPTKWQRDSGKTFLYNAWEFKTLNGKKINSHNCLN